MDRIQRGIPLEPQRGLSFAKQLQASRVICRTVSWTALLFVDLHG
jgi:hypothetical protein